MTLLILQRAFAWLATAYRQRQAAHHLSNLSDHHLRDIGLTRDEIGDAVRGHVSPLDMPVRNRSGGRRGFLLRPGTSRNALR